jgi:hypothetical protein
MMIPVPLLHITTHKTIRHKIPLYTLHTPLYLPAPPVRSACRMRPPPGTGCGPLNCPSCASLLALASLTRISWAAAQFSFLPPHVLSVLDCSALP